MMKASKSADNTSVYAPSGSAVDASQPAFVISPCPNATQDETGSGSSRRANSSHHDQDNSDFHSASSFDNSDFHSGTSFDQSEFDNSILDTSTERLLAEVDYSKCDADTKCKEENGIKLRFLNQSLWKKFSKIGTEMIITKKGRRVFPVPTFLIKGLDPCKLYNVSLAICPVDDMVHRFTGGSWTPYKDSSDFGLSPVHGRNSYLHPSSPNTGDFWMNEPTLFGGLKISNNGSSRGTILLQSMRKYRMSLVIKELGSTTETTFPQELTDFVAVTQYQNEEVTRMKIEHNPFANAFRYPNKSNRDKKENMSSPEEESSSLAHRLSLCNPSSYASMLSMASPLKLPYLPTGYSPYQHSLFEPSLRLPHQNLAAEMYPPKVSNGDDLARSHRVKQDYPAGVVAPEMWNWGPHPHHQPNIGDFPLARTLAHPEELSLTAAMNGAASKLTPFAAYGSEYTPPKSYLFPFPSHPGHPTFHQPLPQPPTRHVSPNGQGNPLNDVRQFSEFAKRASESLGHADAIPLLRKRHRAFEQDARNGEGSRHMNGKSPAKMTSPVSSPLPPPPPLCPPPPPPTSNSKMPSLIRAVPDSRKENGSVRTREDQYQEGVWPERNSGPSDDVPADLTLKERRNIPEGAVESFQGRQSAKKPFVSLKNIDLWCATNEVVVSEQGRAMFPYISLTVTGLEPQRLYYFSLEMVPGSKWLYNYNTSGEWQPCLEATEEHKASLYQHPGNPRLGHQWEHGVIFDSLRLSTSSEGKNLMKVQLRRQYYPVIFICSEDHKWRFPLKEAAFVTVTIDMTPLIYLQRGFPTEGQDIETDDYPTCRSGHRKQRNPKKMKSSPLVPYAMAMSVFDLASGVPRQYKVPTEGVNSFSYARSGKGHDPALMIGEDLRMYGLDQTITSAPTYASDSQPESRVDSRNFLEVEGPTSENSFVDTLRNSMNVDSPTVKRNDS